MKRGKSIPALAATVIFPVAALLFPTYASAHCDGLDGPVVGSARRALETGDVNRVLMWVQPEGAGEVKASFDRTLKVRKLGATARELADRQFFETVVRIHRAGEGEPYTGLKPAGRDLGPAIPAADEAIQRGSADALADLLAASVRASVRERFEEAMATRSFDKNDLDAARRHVAAYVAYMHAVERIHEAAKAPAHDHGHAPQAQAEHAAH